MQSNINSEALLVVQANIFLLLLLFFLSWASYTPILTEQRIFVMPRKKILNLIVLAPE